MGRSPGSNQREGFHISASKFSVLSVGEEEEGKILEGRNLVDDTESEVVVERKAGPGFTRETIVWGP